MEFVYCPYRERMTDEQLLSDVRNVANQLKKESLSAKEYDAHGAFSSSTISRRFGTWNKALLAAGIKARNAFHTKEELFDNLENAWMKKGGQPRKRDMNDKRLSSISSGAYLRMFGKFSEALKAFVEYVNEGDLSGNNSSFETNRESQGSRDVNLRMRFLVMKRDRFRCCACGASPATDPSVVLHIDHIVPWAHGGKTEMENLQTLCDKCNLGKGNVI